MSEASSQDNAGWLIRGLNSMPLLGSLAVLCTVVWMVAEITHGSDARMKIVEGKQADFIRAFDDIRGTLDNLAEINTRLAVISLTLDTALSSGAENREDIRNVQDELRKLQSSVNSIRLEAQRRPDSGD